MRDRGFTYIELLITVAILAILASIVMPLSQLSTKRADEAELRRSLRAIRMAIDDYKRGWDAGKIRKNVGDSGYPPSLEVLIDGVEDASSPQAGKKLRFLRRVPRDPMNDEIWLPPYQTWGLRSYASDPDDPKVGDDVFDVYSKSDGVAIDGTLYRSW